MAIHQGTFQTGTGAVSTTVAVTGVGFPPQAIFFMGENSLGCAISTTNRWAVAAGRTNSSSSGDSGSYATNDQCVVHNTNKNTLNGKLDLQSMDADGFTLVVDDQFATDELFGFIAFSAGQFDAGVMTEPGATGNQSVSSMAFEPDAVIFASGSWTAHNSNQVGRHMVVGYATSSTARAKLMHANNDNCTDCGTCGRYSVDEGELLLTECMGAMQHTCATRHNDSRADFVSMNSDGFTVNWLERKASNLHYWFAMKIGAAAVGSFSTRTDTTQEAVTSVGFEPGAIFLLSNGNSDPQFNMGLASDPANRFHARSVHKSNSTGGGNGAPTGVWDVGTDTMLEEFNNSFVLEASMDLVSMDNLGFTFVMDDADSAAKTVSYLAMNLIAGGTQAIVIS
jgi:hypothetical protein